MLLSILLISFLNHPSSAFLDKLSSTMLNNLRACLLTKSQQPDILCDNRIHSFLIAASDSIQEIYSLYEPEAKAKTSTSKFPGVQTGFLQLVASTMADTSKHPSRAMYGFNKREGKSCWCAYTNDLSQFIQAGCTIPLMFYAVGTMGDPDEDNRVTSYRLQYSLDGYEWLNYNDSYVFTGNTDRVTEVVNNLTPFVARSVRLVPVTWTGTICTRIEFTVSKAIFDPLPPRAPDEILIAGMETGLNIVWSSLYGPDCDETKAMLEFRSVSCSSLKSASSANIWFAVAAPRNVWWHKISMQGRADATEYISSLTISYSNDGMTWTPYLGSKNIKANYDKWSVTTIELEQFYALTIKITSTSYSSNPSFRFEVYYTKD